MNGSLLDREYPAAIYLVDTLSTLLQSADNSSADATVVLCAGIGNTVTRNGSRHPPHPNLRLKCMRVRVNQ